MANVYNPDVVSVTLRAKASFSSRPVTTTLYFRSTEAGDSAEQTNLLDALELWIDVEWQPIVANTWTMQNMQLRHLSGPFGAVIDRSVSYLGAIAEASLDTGRALTVSFRTGFAGRSRRGRAYHYGLVEADIGGNLYDNAPAESIREAYEAIIGIVTPINWTWVVYSRYEDGLPREEGLATPITNVILTDTKVDSQRRRLKG